MTKNVSSLFKRPVQNALPYTLTGDKYGNIYAGIYLGDIEVYNKEGIFLNTIKLPEADKSLNDLGAVVTSSGGKFSLAQLTDGDVGTTSLL